MPARWNQIVAWLRQIDSLRRGRPPKSSKSCASVGEPAVTTTPEADAQIPTIDEWWRDSRRADPNLFPDELIDAFEILARAPQ